MSFADLPAWWRSSDAEDRVARSEGQSSIGRDEEGVLVADAQYVTASVGDDQDRAIDREVGRLFHQPPCRQEATVQGSVVSGCGADR